MFTSGKLLSASSEDMFALAALHLVLKEIVVDVRDGQTVPEYEDVIMRVVRLALWQRFTSQKCPRTLTLRFTSLPRWDTPCWEFGSCVRAISTRHSVTCWAATPAVRLLSWRRCCHRIDGDFLGQISVCLFWILQGCPVRDGSGSFVVILFGALSCGGSRNSLLHTCILRALDHGQVDLSKAFD